MSVRDIVDAIVLMHYVEDKELFVSDEYKAADRSQIILPYNGCGPAWMDETLRGMLDVYFSLFQPAILVHDFDFSQSRKTREKFESANQRLYDNCMLIIQNELPWWRLISRFRARVKARVMKLACDTGGWTAYCDG